MLSTCPVEPELPRQSFQFCCLKFYEFIAKNICYQLSNFQETKVFKLQSFLLRMFLSYNEDDLQVPEMEITDDMTKEYCKFMNSLMAKIYNLFFQERFPKVFPEMRKMLQLYSSKMIGD